MYTISFNHIYSDKTNWWAKSCFILQIKQQRLRNWEFNRFAQDHTAKWESWNSNPLPCQLWWVSVTPVRLTSVRILPLAQIMSCSSKHCADASLSWERVLLSPLFPGRQQAGKAEPQERGQWHACRRASYTTTACWTHTFGTGCFVFFSSFRVITTIPSPLWKISRFFKEAPRKPLRCWPWLWVRFLSHSPGWQPARFRTLSHGEAFAISPTYGQELQKCVLGTEIIPLNGFSREQMGEHRDRGFWAGGWALHLVLWLVHSNHTLPAAPVPGSDFQYQGEGTPTCGQELHPSLSHFYSGSATGTITLILKFL